MKSNLSPSSETLASEVADRLAILAEREGVSVADYLRQTLDKMDAPDRSKPIAKPILAAINDRNPDREFTLTLTKSEFFPLYGLVNKRRRQASGGDDESRDLRRRLKGVVKKLEVSAKQAVAVANR